VSNRVCALQFVAEVEDDLPTPGFRDEHDEITELFADLCGA